MSKQGKHASYKFGWDSARLRSARRLARLTKKATLTARYHPEVMLNQRALIWREFCEYQRLIGAPEVEEEREDFFRGALSVGIDALGLPELRADDGRYIELAQEDKKERLIRALELVYAHNPQNRNARRFAERGRAYVKRVLGC